MQAWVDANKLKPYPAKTQVIVFDSKTMQDKIKPFLPRQILQEDYQAADVEYNLGILSFKHQLVSLCNSYFIGLWDLRRMWRHLTKAAAITIRNA